MLPTLTISSLNEQEKILEIAKALDSPIRLQILRLLSSGVAIEVQNIAKQLNLPLSSTVNNVNILEEAQLITTEKCITSTGRSRICRKTHDSLSLTLLSKSLTDETDGETFIYPIKVNSFYSAINIVAPCGMASSKSFIGFTDEPNIFFAPERLEAKHIWFTSGFLEYRIPITNINKPIKQLQISFEACSEAPFFLEDFKSDISVWINDKEIGVWTCPGDFGGRRGQFTPDFFPINYTQFGLLTNWVITNKFSSLNNSFLSYTRIPELKLDEKPYISLKIGVDPKAKCCGGINLFGSEFGDYAQDIILKITT